MNKMPRRKLIQIEDPALYCNKCGFELAEPVAVDELVEWVNAPCPHCKGNLLTEKEYGTFKGLVKCANWINKYFGWLAVFSKMQPVEKMLHVENNKFEFKNIKDAA